MRGRRQKEYSSLVVCGHVHTGKSSFLGKFVHNLGGIDMRTIDKFERESKVNRFSHQLSKFSWVFDYLKAERESGHSIDWKNWKVETRKLDLSFICTPGKREYLKNCLTGISMCEQMILLVDPSHGPFEASISVGGQARDYLQTAFAYRFGGIVVLVNKMDLVEYNQSRFDQVVESLEKTFSDIGFPKNFEIPIIPISTLEDDNIIQNSTKMCSWWKKKEKKRKYGGMTFLEILDSYCHERAVQIRKEAEKRKGYPFRMSVADTYRIGGIGYCYVGRIESGSCEPGMYVYNTKTNFENMNVKSIERHHMAMGGPLFLGILSINCRPGFKKREDFKRRYKRGAVIGCLKNSPKITKSFEAHVTIIDEGISVKIGYCPVLTCSSQHHPCKWEKIICKWKGRIEDFKEDEGSSSNRGDPEIIHCGESAHVLLKPIIMKDRRDEMCLELPEICERLGRFIIRDHGRVVGYGTVIKIF